MLLDHKKVLEFLPHREPFLFVDSIESIKCFGKELMIGDKIELASLKGIEVTSHYHTKADLEIFKGHFPGNPILPGVIQVEMMAQTSIFGIYFLVDRPESVNLNLAFMGISETKFRKPILPRMDLVVTAICRRVRGLVMSYDCKICHKDILMSEATVLASVQY